MERSGVTAGRSPSSACAACSTSGLAQWRLERMARQVPLDAPWLAPRAAAWDATTLGAWLDEHLATPLARTLLTAGLETVFAASPHELSLLHALFYIHSGKDLDTLFGTTDGAQATRVDGGMMPVAERLAVGLDVRLESPVRRIEHGDTIVVRHERGEVAAERAIVAIPAAPDRRDRVRARPAAGSRRAGHPHADGRGREVHRDLPPTVLARPRPVGHVAVGPRAAARRLRQLAARRTLGRVDGLRRGPRGAPPGPADRGPSAAPRRWRAWPRSTATRPLAAVTYVDHVWEHDPWSGGCYGAFRATRGVDHAGPGAARAGRAAALGRHRDRDPVGRLHRRRDRVRAAGRRRGGRRGSIAGMIASPPRADALRLSLLAAALVACGGRTCPPTTAATPSPDAEVATDPVVARAIAYADATCACTTEACVEEAQDELKAWSGEHGDQVDAAFADPLRGPRLAAHGDRAAACQAKLTASASATASPAIDRTIDQLDQLTDELCACADRACADAGGGARRQVRGAARRSDPGPARAHRRHRPAAARVPRQAGRGHAAAAATTTRRPRGSVRPRPASSRATSSG
jgi:hypothetical protein